MHKRRISGLVIYGNRASTPTKNKTRKLQGGGYVAYSPGYEWRDDPYEMRLMQQEAADRANRAKARVAASKKSTAGKSSDIGKFDAISGGLKAANRNANLIFEKAQDQYFNAVVANEEGWAGTANGKRAYQNVLNMGKKLQNELENDKEHFEDAVGKYKTAEDRDALAVSANNEVLVTDGKGLKRVDINEYTANLDTMNALQVKDLIKWKREQDVSMDSSYIDEFLNNGALGHKSAYDEYIKPHEDSINQTMKAELFKINDPNSPVNKALIGQSNPMTKADNAQFRQLFERLRMGNDSTDTIDSKTKREAMQIALQNIYGDALQYSTDGSRLKASLHSEVLSNTSNRDKLEAIEDKDERAKVLMQMASEAFVSKIIYKGLKVAGESTSSGGASGSELSPTKATAMTRTMAAYVNTFDGITVKTFTNEVEAVSEEAQKAKDDAEAKDPALKVVGFTTPLIKGVISGAVLGTANRNAEDPSEDAVKNSFLSTNKELDKIADSNTVYLADGSTVESVLGGGETNARNMVQSSVIIAPGSSIDMVYLPVNKATGELEMKKYAQTAKIANGSRRDFLTAMKRLNPGTDVSNVEAKDLYEGGRAKGNVMNTYAKWLDMGYEVQKHKDNYAKDKSAANKATLLFAESAAASLKKSADQMEAIFPKDSVHMAAFAKAEVIVDGDSSKIKENYDARTKGRYGDGAFRDIEPGDEEYMEDVVKVDHTNYGWNDNVYRTTVFMPIKNAIGQAGAAGTSSQSASLHKLNEEVALQTINARSISSNPGIDNTYLFLAPK